MHALTVARSVAGLASAAALLLVGCEQGVGTTEVRDAAFIEVDAASTADAGSSDATSGPCSVLDPSACPTDTPRCLPAVGTGTACAASGTGGEGAACGATGPDDCAYGLLCATAPSDPDGDLRCARLCRPGASCSDGSACTRAFEAGGQAVGLCAGSFASAAVSP